MASTNKTENLNLSQFIDTDKPSWLTDYNEDMEKIDSVIGSIVEKIYPVGSYYISAVATSPAQLFGFGTWARAAVGKTIIGVDDADTDFDEEGKTGGTKTHVLTEDQVPNISGSFSSLMWKGDDITTGKFTKGSRNLRDRTATAAGDFGTSVVSMSFGGGQPHNNLPPYETAYIWKRTA